MPDNLSRRAMLLAGAAAGVGLTGCGASARPGTRSTAASGPRLISGSFASEAMRGGTVGWTIAYPPGSGVGDKVPVVISLHGRSATHRTTFSELHLDRVLADVVASGTAPFAVASVDGGDHGYWHRRSDGTDAGAMVINEFVPLLGRHELNTRRLGLYGWSMGGFGALLLAGSRRLPVRAVAVSSPALFTASGLTPAGAFDDAADFDRNDVYGHPSWLDGIRTRIDCGRQDPFYASSKEFSGRIHPKPAGGFIAGAHDVDYWRKVAPAQLRFLGERLS